MGNGGGGGGRGTASMRPGSGGRLNSDHIDQIVRQVGGTRQRAARANADRLDRDTASEFNLPYVAGRAGIGNRARNTGARGRGASAARRAGGRVAAGRGRAPGVAGRPAPRRR